MDEARPLEGKRILVVEDNYLVAEALCDVMRDAGAVPLGPVCSAPIADRALFGQRLREARTGNAEFG